MLLPLYNPFTAHSIWNILSPIFGGGSICLEEDSLSLWANSTAPHGRKAECRQTTETWSLSHKLFVHRKQHPYISIIIYLENVMLKIQSLLAVISSWVFTKVCPLLLDGCFCPGPLLSTISEWIPYWVFYLNGVEYGRKVPMDTNVNISNQKLSLLFPIDLAGIGKIGPALWLTSHGFNGYHSFFSCCYVRIVEKPV